MAETLENTICLWIKPDDTKCNFEALKDKNYCKYHKKYENKYKPNDLNNLVKCSNCKNRFFKKELVNDKCNKCLEAIKRKLQKRKEKDTRDKCSWINQKGEPCPWKSVIGESLCKRHLVYKNYKTTNNLIKCSCCNNLFDPKNENYKTCEKCREFNKIKNEKYKKNQINCKGFTNKNKPCSYKALKGDEYCKKHQSFKKWLNLTNDGFIICSNWVRGCFNKLPNTDFKRCDVCRKTTNYKKNNVSVYDKKYYDYHSEAKRRNIEWNLDKDYIIELIKSKCHYCGISNIINGIDRIDNEKGYIKENCVSCCKNCNRMKCNFKLIQFISIIKYLCFKMEIIPFYEATNNIEILDTTNYFEKAKAKKTFISYKNSCKNRKLNFELNEDEFDDLLSLHCYYCKNFESGANGIDRLNNELGYTKKNVVSCCKTCNKLKNDLKLIEFKEHLNNIFQHYVLNKKVEYENDPRKKMISILSKNNVKITDFQSERLCFTNDIYINKMFNYIDFDFIKNIKIKLEFVDPSTNLEKFSYWNYYRRYISSLKSKNYKNMGKVLNILVKDETSDKYLGILSISSDIKNISCRDNYIGWSKYNQIQEKKREYIANISTCVSCQPFGYNFNGGKLLASLAFSKEVLEQYYLKYGIILQGLSTMSIYGKSVQYDRLPFLKMIGYTRGNSTVNIPSDAIKLAKDYLEINGLLNESLKKDNLFLLKKCFSHLCIPIEDYLMDKQRGFYFGYLNNKAKDFLKSKIDKPYNSIENSKSVNEIFEWWRNRWALQRFNHLKSENRIMTIEKVIKDYNLG